jgi:hypothetical protein
MVNSKQKGGSFERQICKQLSRWISKGEREDLFSRSAMSGGRATVALKQEETLVNQAGDISSIHPLGHAFIDIFIIECKHYQRLQISSFVLGTGGTLQKFWRDTVKDAKKYKKDPILIAKQNHLPVMFLVPTATFFAPVQFAVVSENCEVFLLKDVLMADPSQLLGMDSDTIEDKDGN